MDIKHDIRIFFTNLVRVLSTEDPKWLAWIKRIWIVTIAATVLLVVYFVAVITNPFNLFGPMPSLNQIENPKNDLSSEVISADGVSLGRYFRANRSMASYEELSPQLVSSLLFAVVVGCVVGCGVGGWC